MNKCISCGNNCGLATWFAIRAVKGKMLGRVFLKGTIICDYCLENFSAAY